MSLKEIKYQSSQDNLPISKLKKVLSDLKKSTDIEGAVLVGRRDMIITHDLPKKSNYEAEISQIMTQFNDLSHEVMSTHFSRMFSHCIFDYNGCKVLAKRLENFTLLILLHKKGYVGPAMLDIENSASEIKRILNNWNSIRVIS